MPVVQKQLEAIVQSENVLNFPEVEKLCKVIDSDTRLVVVEPECIHAIRSGGDITSREIQRNSVQIWENRLDMLPVEDLGGDGELYAWTGIYEEDFLGYYAEILPGLRGHA